MKILDSQGRLFGKVSILDLGAALVLLVLVGIFFFPVHLVPLVGIATKPVEVDLIVRGLNVGDPQQLVKQGVQGRWGKTNIIIRNQPHGQIGIKSVKQLPRTVLVPQPDGSLKELPDPRANQFSTDMLLTLGGKAQITDNGPVIATANSKLVLRLSLKASITTSTLPSSTYDPRMRKENRETRALKSNVQDGSRLGKVR